MTSSFSFAVEDLPDGVLAAQVECPEGVTQVLSDRAPFHRAAGGMSDMLRHWSHGRVATGAPLNPIDVLCLYDVAGALAWRVDGEVLRQVKACGAAEGMVAEKYQTIATCFPLPGTTAALNRTPLFYSTAGDMFDAYPLTRGTTGDIPADAAWAFIPWAVGDIQGVTAMWWPTSRQFTQADRAELVDVVRRLASMVPSAVSVATG